MQHKISAASDLDPLTLDSDVIAEDSITFHSPVRTGTKQIVNIKDLTKKSDMVLARTCDDNGNEPSFIFRRNSYESTRCLDDDQIEFGKRARRNRNEYHVVYHRAPVNDSTQMAIPGSLLINEPNHYLPGLVLRIGRWDG